MVRGEGGDGGGGVSATKVVSLMEMVGRLTMVTREDAVGNGRVNDTARGGSGQQRSQGGRKAETEGEEMTCQWTTTMRMTTMMTTQ